MRFERAAWIMALAVTGAACAQDAKIDYSRDIQPILAQHCFACHGADEKSREASLRLDVRDNAIAKKAIVPKDLKASKSVARIDTNDPDRQMPPPEAKKPLNEQQKRLLKAWIEQGAEYSQHWAFTAPKRPAVPSHASVHPVDAFVRERLAREKLAPNAAADRATLLRRVTLDLTGLPPTPQELQAFLDDKSPDAYVKAVDRLLASPRFGERMAMAWLDAARFADTNGFNNDEDRTQWPWRDWLIDAYSRNMPFDRFVVEQLAGDLLPNATLDQRVATAFLRNQVHNTEGGIIPEEYRVEYVADRVHTTATTFLGLSMQCARCHDHKYDPITQREYYQFFSFFQNVSDKPASYSNFVGAEPFIRVPSAEQRSLIASLEANRATIERSLKEREAAAAKAIVEWEKSLTAETKSKLAGAGALLRVPLDEKSGSAIATSDPAIRGAVKGKPKFGEGKIAGAMEFEGSTWVEFVGAPTFEGDTPFSISIWAFPTSNELLALASKMDDGAAHRGWDILLENGKVSTHMVHHWPDNGLKVVTKKAVSLNAWHHVLIAYDGSRKAAGVKVYIDGKLEAADTANDTLKDSLRTDKPLHIGRRGASLPFKGKLDDFQMFGFELNADNAIQFAASKPVDFVGTMLAIPAERRTETQKAAIQRFYLNSVDTEFAKLKADLAETARRKAETEKTLPVLMVMDELAQPREAFVLKRGDYDKRGDRVTAGVPAALPILKKDEKKNATRLDLANWLVSPDHPLTARVAVNRFWEMLFGVGIVKTVEDFGLTGEYPSHPELLDWLSAEFVQTGWDVKRLLRLIVTSETYQQSSTATKDARERDPENRLLARGPRQRLSAETIRDNALEISGLLANRIGGPSVKPYQPAGLWEDVTVERRGRYVPEKGEGLYRRGMYTFWKRTCPPPGLMAFDAPNREVCVARRAITNTPLQALVLLNDPTYLEAARKLAELMMRDGGGGFDMKVNFALKRAISRPATDDELKLFRAMFERAIVRFKADPEGADKLLNIGDSQRDPAMNVDELAAFTVIASTILNLDETITKR